MQQDGLDDDEDALLQQALLESAREAEVAAAAAPPPPVGRLTQGVEILGAFGAKFRCYAAAAVGRGDLDATGKVLLPKSALLEITAFCAGELPPTLLLQLSAGSESAAFVGVAEYVDDAEAAKMLAGLGLRGEALARLRAGGAVAVVFVPRWVRASLLLDPAAPEVRVAVVSLPRATNLRLQPHDDDFGEALGECADPRFALTRLVNRGYVATGRGDVLQLDLSLQDQERRFKVDVVAVQGDTSVRCGTARPPPAVVPGAAPAAEEEVRAACLVDADVEVEFLPSKAAEARESREAAEAAEAAAAVRAVEEAEAAAAVAAAQAAAAAAPTAEDVRAARLRRFQ